MASIDMTKALTIALASFISLAAAPAMAAGDPAAGEAQVAACAACHGQDGATGLDPTYPNLAGQNEKYLTHQLMEIRDGGRNIALMAGQLNGKSDQDLADMAAYYASLPAKISQAQGDDETLAKAQNIYRGGIAEKVWRPAPPATHPAATAMLRPATRTSAVNRRATPSLS